MNPTNPSSVDATPENKPMQACGDVGIMAEAKSLLADIVEVWFSKSTANYIRAGKLRAEDIKAAYLIRDFLLKRDAPETRQEIP